MSGVIYVDQDGRRHEDLRRRILTGDLERIRRGRYVTRGSETDLVCRVEAAVSRLDGDPVASHDTAAALWGLPLLGRPDKRIHLTRPRRTKGTSRRYPDLVLHHAALPVEHVAVHQGVPVTTPARTVADLARTGSFRAGVVVADAALRMRLCGREEIQCVSLDCAGWPGVRQVRAVADFANPASASPLESISRVAFAEFRLPTPQLQAPVGPFDIADFMWAAYRVIGEADGLVKYTDADVLRKEKLRQERFAQMGYEVVRWTWREAYHRPDTIAFRALEVLQRRGYRG
ncbi:DUF559 domain-containing protein [Actinomycetes bacterium KLBMP 9797]